MTDLVTSLALHLDALGVAQYSEDAFTVGYVEKPELPAVTFDELPSSPDTAVSLTVAGHQTDRDPFNPDITVRLRFRGAGQDSRVVHRIAERVFDQLDTSEPMAGRQYWPGGAVVLMCLRVVRGNAIRDTNERWMRADSYRITTNTRSGD
jgi:hypothetical protein